MMKLCLTLALVVAQLVEWSLPTPNVRSSNPVICKNLKWIFAVNCIEKMKIKKKGREWPIFVKKYALLQEILFFCITAHFILLQSVWLPSTYLWPIMPRQLKIHCDDKRGFERSLERMEVGGGRGVLRLIAKGSKVNMTLSNASKILSKLGAGPGLVVMEGGSRLMGHEFETRPWILDGYLFAFR